MPRTPSYEYQKKLVMRRWIKEHGLLTKLPYCACGCGQRVKVHGRGVPEYIRSHNFRSKYKDEAWVKARTGKALEVRFRNEGLLEVQKFAEAVHKVRKQKGWTVKETADRGGWSYTMLQDYLYDKDRKHIKMSTARDFLLRLSGKALPPTPYQRRKMAEHKRRVHALETSFSQTTMKRFRNEDK